MEFWDSLVHIVLFRKVVEIMDWHSAYNIHISPLLRSICDICKDEISCESMQLHWKRDHQLSRGKVKCQICEKNLDPGFMRKHLINKHDKKKDELSYYKCPLCDFKGIRRTAVRYKKRSLFQNNPTIGSFKWSLKKVFTWFQNKSKRPNRRVVLEVAKVHLNEPMKLHGFI